MTAVPTGPALGLAGQLGLLGVLDVTVGLDALGWVAGLACGATASIAVARGLRRAGCPRLGPANRVTLVRAVLVGGVAALVADAFARPIPVGILVGLATVALTLDAADGWVARQTATASSLGARFDMEVDAFLILVLSSYVARESGAWLLVIGMARYAFVASSWLLPWMRAVLPPRYWRKVVAAVQGIVLTAAAAGLLHGTAGTAVLAGALAMLAESFGRDVWWLRRHARAAQDTASGLRQSVNRLARTTVWRSEAARPAAAAARGE